MNIKNDRIRILSPVLGSHPERQQDDCDCDCACAQPIQARPTLDLDYDLPRWKARHFYETPLDENFTAIANPLGPFSVVVLDAKAMQFVDGLRKDTFPAASVNPEYTAALLHLATVGLLMKDGEDSCNPETDTLAAWLHLTDRCNLRCSYCYLPHVREDMSLETGCAAVDAIFRSATLHGYKIIKLKFAGGEPLLQFPLILELHAHARELAKIHGIDLEEVVLSNGTLLTEQMARTLKSLNIRLMISLDGLGNYHDTHRPYAGGHGSFADVAEAVEIALANGLTPNISITISSRTIDGLPDVMQWVLDRDLPFSLNYYRENELSASNVDMKLDEEKIIRGMLTTFKVIEANLPRRSVLGGIIDRANLSAAHTHTCGVGQNYLVFDQHGQIAKCQMHIRKPITNLHVVDPLAVIRADKIGVQNLSVEEKEGCKTCEWKNWCAGGCAIATVRATGRYDVKSPNCNIYKALFPEAVKLEGLRLLKYADNPAVVMQY
jgi:uncharacterized protein